MRIQRPRPVRGNIRQQVAIGEKIVVRRWRVYRLPPTPNRGNGDERLNRLGKQLDGLCPRGGAPAEGPAGRPLASITPPHRGESAWIVTGEKAKNLLGDAWILPRFREGALFVKTSP